jgi:hypothetical protein
VRRESQPVRVERAAPRASLNGSVPDRKCLTGNASSASRGHPSRRFIATVECTLRGPLAATLASTPTGQPTPAMFGKVDTVGVLMAVLFTETLLRHARRTRSPPGLPGCASGLLAP